MKRNLCDLIEEFLLEVNDETRYILLFKKESALVFNKYDFYKGELYFTRSFNLYAEKNINK